MIPLLSKPKHGWCIVGISSWSDRASYIDDVPVELLQAIQTVLSVNEPAAVLFDAEGWEFTIEFYPEQVEITTCDQDDEVTTRVFDLPAYYLAADLIKDIRRDLDDWVMWPVWSDEPWFNKKEQQGRRDQLLTYCDIIERLLPKHFS